MLSQLQAGRTEPPPGATMQLGLRRTSPARASVPQPATKTNRHRRSRRPHLPAHRRLRSPA